MRFPLVTASYVLGTAKRAMNLEMGLERKGTRKKERIAQQVSVMVDHGGKFLVS
jgi:hypothetical protein